MAQLWDQKPNAKGANSSDPLPNPELNPLMNPILAQHLGRWAQVYVTNPPEKREQAILELLRELKTQTREANLPVSSVHAEPATHGNSITAQSSQVNRTPARAGSDWEMQWLRDKTALGVDGKERTTRPTWKLALAGFGILFASVAYLQWGAVRNPSTHARPLQTSTGPTEQESTASVERAPSQAGSAAGSSLVSPQSSAAADEGSRELLLARQYLAGKGTTRDSAEAAKWLWKSVGKRNARATLLLADLYMSGDGVPKSCDQARMLLAAAASRGIAEAGQRLRDLESSGCP